MVTRSRSRSLLPICTEWNIPFETRTLSFDERDDAKAWIIRNQFGRRNLSLYQRSELALQLESLIGKKAKENLSAAGKSAKPFQNSEKVSLEPVSTVHELAQLAGVSHDTIAKVKAIRDEAPDELKEQVRSGKVSINKAYGKVRPKRRFDLDKPHPKAKPAIVPLTTYRPAPATTVTLSHNPAIAAAALGRLFPRDYLVTLATLILEDQK